MRDAKWLVDGGRGRIGDHSDIELDLLGEGTGQMQDPERKSRARRKEFWNRG
jgi:hypothetical protein